MAFRLAARRHTRFAVTLVALCFAAGVARRGGPGSQSSRLRSNNPQRRRRRRRLRRARRAGQGTAAAPAPAVRRAASSAAGFDDQADAGAARAHANFTATAGSIRLFDDKGEPQADIAYTSYQLDGGDRDTPPGDVSVQWRAGGLVGLAAVRRCRPVADVDRRRRRGVFRLAGPAAQCRDLARLHRSRLHRSRRHRL